MEAAAKQNNWSNPKTRPKQVSLVRVSGQAHTYEQIIARCNGLSYDAVQQRIKRLQRAKKPVTWEALGVTENPASKPQ